MNIYMLLCARYERNTLNIRILPCSGLLRGVRLFETDVSGLPVVPTFKGQNILLSFLGDLIYEDGTDT